MKKIVIRNKYNNEIILEKEYEDVLELRNADLINADLSEANLRNADLRYADLRNADLINADLINADLSEANLRYADLRYADLINADLSEANLRNANLRYADLRNADLSEANLRNANLRYADLRNADLRYADLRYADLRNANLRYADLRNADLRYADLRYADLSDVILDEKEKIRKGIIIKQEKIVYKKCDNKIVELELQKGSIVFSINNNKCRTNKAKVIAIDNNYENGTKISSDYNKKFVYEVGKMVEIEDFDLIYNVECSTGIHFFFNKEDAKNYE